MIYPGIRAFRTFERIGQISVLIVDDHPVFSLGLAGAITTALGKLECQCVATLAEATVAIENDHFLLILLDFGLPCGAFSDNFRKLRSASPTTPIVVISGLEQPSMVKDVRSIGANGFISKAASADLVLSSISTILNYGLTVFPPEMAPEERHQTIDLGRGLTARERQILDALASGLTTPGIAETFHIRPKTVQTHLGNIFAKLGVQDRVGATRWALTEGRLTPRGPGAP